MVLPCGLFLFYSLRSDDLHPAQLPADELLAECNERRLRRGGPGGQHRNKVETAVELTHEPTGVAAEANERRRQQQNRQVAIFRLRLRLALAVRSQPEPREPSELWLTRRKGQRIAVSDSHEDFPALLAEALDHLAASDWDAGTASDRLGVSTSQLVKLLKLEPAALEMLNAKRTERGQGPLR